MYKREQEEQEKQKMNTWKVGEEKTLVKLRLMQTVIG